MKILVLGNAIVDVILNIKHLPQTGDDIYCQKQAVNIWGCAYNVATILKHFLNYFTPKTSTFSKYVQDIPQPLQVP